MADTTGSGLTDKQERFCLEYVVDYNGTQAAIRAGYSEKTAGEIAYENLNKPQIAARVAELNNATADELGLTKRRLLSKLWDTIEKAYEGAPKTDKDGGPIIVNGEMVMEWAPSSVIRAVELLMKHRGDLADKVTHDGELSLVVKGAEDV